METVRINGQDYTSSLSDAEIAFMGNFSLPTTAQTLSGAIAEHENDISELNSNFVGKGTHTINVFGCYGFVSGGAKAIYLFIPVNIAGDVTSISSITALKIGLRTSGSGGYAGGADNLDDLSNVVQKEVQKLHGYIMVRLDSTNAWTNCVNNSVVCGTANITFTLS